MAIREATSLTIFAVEKGELGKDRSDRVEVRFIQIPKHELKCRWLYLVYIVHQACGSWTTTSSMRSGMAVGDLEVAAHQHY